jgi:uncharacterized protein YaiE (UPF0345 family)
MMLTSKRNGITTLLSLFVFFPHFAVVYSQVNFLSDREEPDSERKSETHQAQERLAWNNWIVSKPLKTENGINDSPANRIPLAGNVSTIPAEAITGFTLVNADNETVIQPLASGATLNLATLPTKNLNIVAITSPAIVGSVVFNLSGVLHAKRTESGAPYTLFGDANGNYAAWTPAVGSYTLKATPHSGSNGSGMAGTALTISFTVINQATSNQVPVANAGPDKTITLPTNAVSLQGSGSDPDGTIAAYSWTQVSGPGTATFSSKTTAQPTVSALVQGTYTFSLVVTDNQGARSTADGVTVTVNPATTTGSALYRLNTGGAQVSTSLGSFAADAHYSPSPGSKSGTSTGIHGTTDDALYQSERYGASFGYALPVSNGQYKVVLHFAEIYFTATGKRVFDASIEGTKVLDNYDIVARAGGAYTAKTETFTASVSDGVLNINFSSLAGDGGVNNAKVAAIEVLSATSTNQVPVANAGPDKTITLPTNAVSLQGSGSDPDGTIAAYSWTQVSGPGTATFSSKTTAQPTVSALVQGTYTFSLVVTDNQGARSTADGVTVTVNPATTTGSALYRLNTGGAQVSTSLGSFAADAHYSPSPGSKSGTSTGIHGTTDDALYQSERYGASFGYALPVSNGQYKVVLHFAEIYFTATGKRVFDASIEGTKVLDNYDIVARAGGAYTAKTETFTASVSDGVLNINFSSLAGDGGVNNAKVAAIEVLSATSDELPPAKGPGVVTGTLKKWQTVSIDFAGPASNEKANAPNPFLDYRLQVLFTHQGTGKTYNVPGFFDGDGKGGAAGNIWRVRFNPDAEGGWTYRASFRRGPNLAVDLNPSAGIAESFDGAAGSFTIAPADASAPGFLKRGRLGYAGGFYMRFQDGSYWIKGGADSPENFLGLDFTPHIGDWLHGDPDWNNGEGKGIIGALNYLGAVNVNSIYFMPMNIGGDAKDTWPFVDPVNAAGSSSNDNLHYAIGKLRHWEMIFEHAQRKGIMLHFVLNEAEEANKKELDNATLGIERKLYYRELVARFGHHNALQWNLCEEYNYTYVIDAATIKTWAQYLQDVDPYDHPVTVHNPGDPKVNWAPFVGDKRFTVTSLQYAGSTAGYGNEVEYWRNKTQTAGHPIPVSMDELRSTSTTNMAEQRKQLLWPTYLSGGGGLEYYFAGQDQSLQDFKPYDALWKWTWYARKFMQENLPFWQMVPADGLLNHEATTWGHGQVFAKTGQVYAIYLPDASKGGDLDLGGVSGLFDLRWFNPRTGLFEGTTRMVGGGATVNLGLPPGATSEDWVVLLKVNSSTTGLDEKKLHGR